MFALLLPVKEFHHSKQRLAGWLSPPERQTLARTMFEDVWATLQSSIARERLLVISSEPIVTERCELDGVACHPETAQQSHSNSVAEGTRWAMRRGVTSLLSVAIDTPAITAEEIATLAGLAQQYSVVIVPSADGTGTNALLRTPADAIAPQFGPGSCALHVAQAESSKRSHLVHSIASFGADIDTLEDAEHFLSLDHPCRTTTLLREWFAAQGELHRGVALCS